MALLSVWSDTKGMIISDVWLVVNECGLVRGCDVSGLSIVVSRAIEELSLAIRQRFRQLLSSEVHIRIEVDVSQTHPSGETEPKEDGPNVVVTGHIIEKTLQTSSHGPLKEHGIRSTSQEKESSVSETLNRDGTLGGVKWHPEVLRDLLHVVCETGDRPSQHFHTLLDIYKRYTTK